MYGCLRPITSRSLGCDTFAGQMGRATFLGWRLAARALVVQESACRAHWLSYLFGLASLPLGPELVFDWALSMGLWPNKIGNSKRKIK